MDPQFTKIKGGVGAPLGFLTSAVSCGIKNPDATRLDLALILSESPCVSAGTFTTNRVKAAPVKLSHAHLRRGELRAIIANSGLPLISADTLAEAAATAVAARPKLAA